VVYGWWHERTAHLHGLLGVSRRLCPIATRVMSKGTAPGGMDVDAIPSAAGYFFFAFRLFVQSVMPTPTPWNFWSWRGGGLQIDEHSAHGRVLEPGQAPCVGAFGIPIGGAGAPSTAPRSGTWAAPGGLGTLGDTRFPHGARGADLTARALRTQNARTLLLWSADLVLVNLS
jgi:hypothetical protein